MLGWILSWSKAPWCTPPEKTVAFYTHLATRFMKVQMKPEFTQQSHHWIWTDPFFFNYPVGPRVRSLKWLGFKRMGLTMKAFMYVLYKTAALYRPHHKDSQLIAHSQHGSGTCSCATGRAAPLSVHWSFVWYHTETMGWFLFHKSRRNNNQCVTGLTLFPFVGLERHEKKPTLMTKIKFAVNPR